MFEPTDKPRLFGLPPGADFPRALVAGLVEKMQDKPPQAMAQVEIYVNTRRMQRRIKTLFDEGAAMLLPRIKLVTDLAKDARFADLPPPASSLRRRLELTQLISKLLDQQRDLAPRSALFDLADSLASLMDEMQGEGVAPQVIRDLEITDESGHWQRSLEFVKLVDRFFGADSQIDLDSEARQRRVIERLASDWQHNPPTHPIIVAGSTGSRGATAILMQAVANLPQGAVILPGLDTDMPRPAWDHLVKSRDDTGQTLFEEDHPQARFAILADRLNIHPGSIEHWSTTITPPNPARNKLLSLALRPAPVTDQWLIEGKDLTGLTIATENMTLVETQSTRAEAMAIALSLRSAIEDGKTAALITPDRTLTWQVTAALDRWGIIPDDSAGRPLPLSAPGRLLRHVAALFGQKLTSEALLTLLKHPLTNTGSDARGAHLLHTRELELKLRRFGPPFPTGSDLIDWAEKGDEDRQGWAQWLAKLISGLEAIGERPLAAHLDHHIALTERLCAGPIADGSGALWQEAAGKEAKRWVDELRHEADHAGTLSASDYQALFHSVLQRGEVREATFAHPNVMIWGTLEARVQGADIVILSGLNEGIWPEPAKPDPWLNRSLRQKAGLLLPERQIGLSAHDFQQAIAAKEVILTRAIRDAEAQTVPSRWLNRLTNLLGGVSEEGSAALDAMRKRGAELLAMAQQLDTPLAEENAARRPSPQPPVESRPKEISITEVQRLIRDPYAIYARRILQLSPLDPLRHAPDAPLRGILTHMIVEDFIKSGPVTDAVIARQLLLDIGEQVFAEHAPWPAAQRIWQARLGRVADWFVAGEIARQQTQTPLSFEQNAAMQIPTLDITLKGKIDRIDRKQNGSVAVYDYKTGAPPSLLQQTHFDKQLMLSALLAERGAVKGVEAADVAEVAYVGLGANPKFDPIPLENGDTSAILTELTGLLSAYQTRSRGYTSRRAVDTTAFAGTYDHLARFGEWDESADPDEQVVG